MEKSVFHYIGVATIADWIVGRGHLNIANIVFTAAIVMLFDFGVKKWKEMR